ncbi:hypothetical protein [Streptomyces sp. NPDC087538]|uniref:hypothetical protein n=1 Tax=Streptomyces sp. NPDC087538 TaxID=3365797 RepID=UPI0037FB7FDD
MTNLELVTVADVRIMQGMAQRVTATRPDLVNSDASFGELAWNWGKGQAGEGANWRRGLWFSGGEMVAWGWAHLPHQVRRSDGSVKDVTSAYLAYQVHLDHAGPVDEVIDRYDDTAADTERTVMPSAADEFALKRWAARMGAGKGDAAAGDAPGTGGRGHSYDGRLPGCAGTSPGAWAVLRRRFRELTRDAPLIKSKSKSKNRTKTKAAG